jgi:hypothetical protein
MRIVLGSLLACLVLAASGCGGGGDSSATGDTAAASIAPASAVAYATINTDLDSDQVDQLEELLAKFPDRDRLLAEIQQNLAEDDLSWENDVRPALGETLDVVLLDLEGAFVAVLKPADKAKLEALLAKSDEPTARREVDGWTVIAETDAVLDRFEAARDSGALEDDDQFESAMDELPEEALAKLYIDGEAATRAAESAGAGASGANRVTAFAAALAAESSGLKLDGALSSELEGDLASVEPYEAKLIDAAPDDALFFLSGNGYQKLRDAVRALDEQSTLRQFRELLGIELEEAAQLFDREFAFWVAPGAPIPEVTLLAETDDEAAAKKTLDSLASKLQVFAGGARRQTEIGGVQADQVVIEGFTITYATLDGRFIVTTRPNAVADVRTRAGGGLSGSAEFSEAVEDADMPDATFGFMYVDVEAIAEMVQGFAGAAGEEVPPEVQRNIDPLGAFVFYADGEPEDLKLSAFLSIE